MSQEEVINVLKNGEWMSTKDLTLHCTCSYHNVTRAIKKLYAQRVVFMKFDKENKINRYKLREDNSHSYSLRKRHQVKR